MNAITFILAASIIPYLVVGWRVAVWEIPRSRTFANKKWDDKRDEHRRLAYVKSNFRHTVFLWLFLLPFILFDDSMNRAIEQHDPDSMEQKKKAAERERIQIQQRNELLERNLDRERDSDLDAELEYAALAKKHNALLDDDWPDSSEFDIIDTAGAYPLRYFDDEWVGIISENGV